MRLTGKIGERPLADGSGRQVEIGLRMVPHTRGSPSKRPGDCSTIEYWSVAAPQKLNNTTILSSLVIMSQSLSIDQCEVFGGSGYCESEYNARASFTLASSIRIRWPCLPPMEILLGWV